MLKNKKGFTLIELIAVVIILAILMMIAIPSITSVIEDSRKKGTISTLQEFVNKARTDISLGLDEIEKYSFFNGDNKAVIEQNPENPSEMIGIVSLKDRAMGVSGDYQTYVEIDGEMYHHILDKDTGYPVKDKKMVVVLCDNAFDADLLSTTFFLMPIDEVISYVDGRKDLDVLIVDKDMNIITSKNFKYEEIKK